MIINALKDMKFVPISQFSGFVRRKKLTIRR